MLEDSWDVMYHVPKEEEERIPVSLFSFETNCEEERQAEISAEFHRVWCKNNVFCSGSLSSARWKLYPLFSSVVDRHIRLNVLIFGFSPSSFSFPFITFALLGQDELRVCLLATYDVNYHRGSNRQIPLQEHRMNNFHLFWEPLI